MEISIYLFFTIYILDKADISISIDIYIAVLEYVRYLLELFM